MGAVESPGFPLRWPVYETGNSSSELFVEGQALPLPSKPSAAEANLACFYARAVAKVSGHMRDVQARGGYSEDQVQKALDDAREALLKFLETTLVGSAADKGIASIIDATDTYAGLAQSSHTLWVSEENGSISTLDLADLDTLEEELVLKGASPTDWLFPMEQLMNYSQISGSDAKWPIMRQVGQGGPFDMGALNLQAPSAAHNGIPITVISTLTNTEAYLIDVPGSGINFRFQRDVEVRDLGPQGDDDSWQISLGGALQVKNRRLTGKLTGITA
jgi:hypothetical protein